MIGSWNLEVGGFMKKKRFIEDYLGFAREAGELFDLNPVVILAQSALETGWGQSTLCREYHNYFGISGYGKANEFWRGRTVQLSPSSSLLFRCYDEPLLSFLDYGRLIRGKYKMAADMSFYPEAFAKEIAYSAYISEVNGDNREAYQRGLVRICRMIGEKMEISSRA